MKRTAEFSPDRKYRYYLTITWDWRRPKINFLMLNPSTADEYVNDPTVERCERRARMWGYGGVIITNIFALRSTDPKELYIQMLGYRDTNRIVGKGNDLFIKKAAEVCEGTICGWGSHGQLCGRGIQVKEMLMQDSYPLFYLKLSTNTGQPYHPLYLSYNLTPQEWQ